MARSSDNNNNINKKNMNTAAANSAAYYAKSREIPRGSHSSSHDSNNLNSATGSSSRHSSKSTSSSIPRHSQASHQSRNSHTSTTSTSHHRPPGQTSAAAKKNQRVDGNYSNRWNWNQTGAETDDDGLTQDELDQLLPALAYRSYHLPGNTSNTTDWCQYLANNHPVLGIGCHHRLHPIRWPVRILHFLGSFIFGLLVTNMIWLWFLHSQEHDEDTIVMIVSMNGERMIGNVTTNDNDNNSTLDNLTPQGIQDFMTNQTQMEITKGMALLWTVGSASHAIFDNVIWYVTACVCCLPGHSLENLQRYKKYGIALVVFTVLCLASVATLVVVLRAALQDEDDAAQDLQDLEDAAGLNTKNSNGTNSNSTTTNPFAEIEDKSDFQFLISYSVEMALALFVYYPIVMTILFSGILGCGRIPVLGGRPYELRLEQMQLREKEEQLAAERAEKEQQQQQQQQQRIRQSSRVLRSGGRRPN
jgi:hypothetical protein